MSSDKWFLKSNELLLESYAEIFEDFCYPQYIDCFGLPLPKGDIYAKSRLKRLKFNERDLAVQTNHKKKEVRN